MPIQFPDTSVNNNVSFFLDFEGVLDPLQTNPPALRDKTDKTTVTVADSGGETVSVTTDGLFYTANTGYLSTTHDAGLAFGTDPYTIEILLTLPAARTLASEGILSVGAASATNNWELLIDSVNRPIFFRGTTAVISSTAITVDTLAHVAIVRTGTGTNESTVYLNGTSVATFTDDTDYNYTEGLYIGSGRDGAGFTEGYIKAVRVSNVAQYTENFIAPSSFPYVAIGDTYSYDTKVYKWSGVKWFDRSKFNANIPGEYQNYVKYTASSNTTTIDVSAANFVEVDLVIGQDTEFVFENEALEQNLLMKVNDGTVVTGYDLENATYDNVSFNVASQESNSRSVFFKPDGTKMYVTGFDTDSVYQYSLSTAWDISTASYDSVSFDVSTQDATPVYSFFKPDGTKMYLTGNINDNVYQYSLSTAWDISTASYDSVSFDVSSQDLTIGTVFFKPDGTKMYIAGTSNDSVYQYSLSTAWDISTASYDSVSFSVTAQESSPNGLFFKPDGTKMYALGQDTNTVYQYNTGSITTSPTPTWPSNVTWSTGSAPTISSTTLIEFNKYNGIWHGNVLTENL